MFQLRRLVSLSALFMLFALQVQAAVVTKRYDSRFPITLSSLIHPSFVFCRAKGKAAVDALTEIKFVKKLTGDIDLPKKAFKITLEESGDDDEGIPPLFRVRLPLSPFV